MGNALKDLAVSIGYLDNKVEIPFKAEEKDGNCTVKYTPQDSGSLQVEVKAFDKQVKNSPFTVIATAIIDVTKTTMSGPGLEKAQEDLATHFFIHAKDKNGNGVTKATDRIAVSIVHANGSVIKSQIEEENDGNYRVSYTPEIAGSIVIDINAYNKVLNGSPITVQVESVIDVSKTTTSGKI